MPANLTTVSAAVKEAINEDLAETLWNNPDLNPLLKIIQKGKPGDYAFGRNGKFLQAVQTGRNRTVGAQFAKAKAKAEGTAESTVGGHNRFEQWEITQRKTYAFAQFSNDVLDMDEYELIKHAQKEMDDMLDEMTVAIAKDLCSNGYGVYATVLAVNSGPDYIDIDPALVNRFKKGDELGCADAVEGAFHSVNALAIEGIDEVQGRLFLSDDPVGEGWGTTDVIVNALDHDLSSTLERVKIDGIKAWLGDGATPNTGTFNGVVVTDDPDLTGRRRDCSGDSGLDASIIKTVGQLWTAGYRTSHVVMSNSDLQDLIDLKEAYKLQPSTAKEWQLGYQAVKLMTDAGVVDVIGEHFWEPGTFFAGDFNKAENAFLVCPKELVRIDDKDGNMFLRVDTSPDYQARAYTRTNLVMNPGAFITGYGF